MSGPYRILVVEDDELNLKLVRDVLSHAGHQVMEARSGEQGVELAAECRPGSHPDGSPTPGYRRHRDACGADVGERLVEQLGVLQQHVGVTDGVVVRAERGNASESVSRFGELVDPVEEGVDRGDRLQVGLGRGAAS